MKYFLNFTIAAIVMSGLCSQDLCARISVHDFKSSFSDGKTRRDITVFSNTTVAEIHDAISSKKDVSGETSIPKEIHVTIYDGGSTAFFNFIEKSPRLAKIRPYWLHLQDDKLQVIPDEIALIEKLHMLTIHTRKPLLEINPLIGNLQFLKSLDLPLSCRLPLPATLRKKIEDGFDSFSLSVSLGTAFFTDTKTVSINLTDGVARMRCDGCIGGFLKTKGEAASAYIVGFLYHALPGSKTAHLNGVIDSLEDMLNGSDAAVICNGSVGAPEYDEVDELVYQMSKNNK
jgi:hypothetical protein